MNFASWSFILLFLPATFLCFRLAPAATGPRAAILILASALFYTLSGWHNALVLAASLAVNGGAGALIVRTAGRRRRRALMWAAVAFNLGLLLAFKVRSGEGFRVEEAILIPLALSYVTFQQIGFVTACHRGRIERVSPRDYLFFILFFPQLVMGPIVRFEDVAAQLREGRLRAAAGGDAAIGLSIFIFGLAQKVLLADRLAPAVDTIFDTARHAPIGTAESWFAIIAFQLQLYFDFAGYADMAIGLGRMFGISLPINFDRPLFAKDRFDLWRRWHISFVVFMRGHVFLPLVRHWHFALPAALAATGILSGLWHGLGWTFVIWGLIQTAILLIVHARRARDRIARRGPVRTIVAIALTFLTSALIGGLFRSPDLETARNIYGALAGLGESGALLGPRALIMLPICALAAWGLPNSAQFFARHWNAIDLRQGAAPPPPHPLRRWLEFGLTPRWAAVAAVALALCLLLGAESRRFVYVQF